MEIKKKILKNFLIQHFLALISSVYIYIVFFTSKIHIKNIESPKEFWGNNKSFILAFWHSQLMMISFCWNSKNNKLNILASGHSDGRFGAIIAKYLNSNNIPTYKSNKKINLRPIFELLKEKKCVAITPDGPRGPKEKVSEGIIKIAKSSKIPIIPIGFWSSKNSKLKSWDSFLISLPFSKCTFVWGQPLIIPSNLNDKEIKKYSLILENKINDCINEAKSNCK